MKTNGTGHNPLERLRTLLALDAAASTTAGAAAIVAAGPIAMFLGVNAGLVRVAGVALVVFGIEAALLRRSVPGWGLQAVVGFVALREIVVIVALALGSRDGLSIADAAVGLLLVDAVALGALELAAARRTSARSRNRALNALEPVA